jgi:hypothetical protein
VDKELMTDLEKQLVLLSQHIQYPTTPDIVQAIKGRQEGSTAWNWKVRYGLAALMGVVLVTVILFIPPVRAQVMEFVQIGAVRIFIPDRSITEDENIFSEEPMFSDDRQSTLSMLMQFAGETSLDAAREVVDFPIKIPTHPVELGLPDRIFLQKGEGQMLILVWMLPESDDEVKLSLHIIGPEDFSVLKYPPSLVEGLEVNGQEAFWTTGRYVVEIRDGRQGLMRLIEGHVLIWAEGDLTYRLETDFSLDEALQVAESLQEY